MKTIDLGIVGCGVIANDYHIPEWLKRKEIRIKAVCDKNSKLAEETARKVGHGTQWYEDFNLMLSKEHLDLVDICVPPQAHFSLTMHAIESGCDVVVEKPMATSLKEAKSMVASAEKNNSRLFVIHQSLFNPLVVKAKALVQERRLGDLISMHITFLEGSESWGGWINNKNHWSHSLPGGHFFDALAHPIYLMQEFLGKLSIKAMNVKKLTDHDWVIADDLYALLDGEQGGGIIHVAFGLAKDIGYYDIHGTKKSLRVFPFSLAMVEYEGCNFSPLQLALGNLNHSFQLTTSTFKAAIRLLSKGFRGPHSLIIPKIVESLKKDVKPPVDLGDALEVMRVLEEMCQQIEATRCQ